MKIIRVVTVFLILLCSSVDADLVDIKLKKFIHLVSNYYDKTVLLDKNLDYEMTLINTKHINKITYFSMFQDILNENDLVMINRKDYYYIKEKDIFNDVINIANVSDDIISNLALIYDIKTVKYKDNNYIVTYKNKNKYSLFKRIVKKLNYTDTLKITGEIYKLDNNKLEENDIDVSFVIDTINRGLSANVDMSKEGLLGFGFTGQGLTVSGFIKYLESNKYLEVTTRPNFLTVSGKEALFKSGYTYRQEQTRTDNLNTQVPISTKSYSNDDIGLIITLLPTLFSNNKVQINLKIVDSSLTAVDENRNVIKSQFEYSSTIIMNLDEEIVLAGVDVIHKETNKDEVPFLSGIYGIGYLFKSKSEDNKKSSVIIKLRVQKL